jgi:hypothetical protein
VSIALRDVVFDIRELLGEQVPNYWNPNTIIADINEALQDICSYCQNLETIIQFPWPFEPGTTTLSQEAKLPVHVDNIIWCGYYSGQFFQLSPLADDSVLVANRVQGIPIGFYTRTDTKQILTQGGGNNTGDMFVVQTQPNPSNSQDYFTALGFWPIPQQQLNTTLMCTRFHEYVSKPLDRCGVPIRFKQAITNFVMWKAKRKQQAYDEAADYRNTYKEIREEMNFYYINNKQLKGGPEYGGQLWPTLARGSSSVIFIDQNPQLR